MSQVINNNLKEELSSFTSISLEEMDSVSYMDRTDTKYIFNSAQLNELLHSLVNDYRILEVNGMRISPYETLYFDTTDYLLYRMHHNSKPSRFKIRYRKYGSTGAVYFEIKSRNSKGRTIKKRIQQQEISTEMHPSAADFLIQNTTHSPEVFEPKLFVNYSRITFVSKSMNERVTVDINLHYMNEGFTDTLDNIVIAEVKGEKSHSSVFSSIMKSKHIRSGSISKYCIGIAKEADGIKSNNFKRQLLFLNKISNDTSTVS